MTDGVTRAVRHPGVGCWAAWFYTGPSFLDANLATLPARHRHTYQFHRGPAPSAAEIRRVHASASSVSAFACVAVPHDAGKPAYCVDSTGRICWTADGRPPAVVDGLCPLDCPPLP